MKSRIFGSALCSSNSRVILLWKRVFVLLSTLLDVGLSLENEGLRSLFSLRDHIGCLCFAVLFTADDRRDGTKMLPRGSQKSSVV